MSTHLLHLLLLLSLIVAASKIGASLSSRIRQPAVFGELLVGLILGPSVLNLFGWSIFHDPTLEVIVRDLAEIGVILLMFIAGLETDLAEMRRVGLAAFSGAMGGVILPMAAGTGLGLLFHYGLYESLFIGTIMTATSVSISAQTLMELGHLRSKEGSTILGAAIIDDVLGIIALSVVVALGSTGGGAGAAGGLARVLGQMLLFFVLSVVLGSVLLEGIVLWVQRRVQASEALFALALVVVFLYSFAAQALGRVATITGAYIAGVLFSRTSIHKAVEKQVGAITYGLLAPIFFVSIGLEANVHLLTTSTLLLAVVVTVAAILTKLFGAAFGTKLVGFDWGESIRVGTGMVSRGEVALIVTSIGFGAGVIGQDVFAVMVIMTLVTTIATPVMLRVVFARVEKGGAEAGPEAGETAAAPKGRPAPAMPSALDVLEAGPEDDGATG